MRTALLGVAGLSALAAAALVAPAALAQSALRVVDPSLSVDGRAVGTVGAMPVGGVGVLVIAVPGQGTYRVSDHPFAGARRAGGFDGRTLAFAADGQSVRLVSREPLLDGGASAPAFVAFEPSGRSERGLARLSIAGSPAYASRMPRGPQAASPPVERDETRRLRAEIDRLTAERAALLGERARAMSAGPAGSAALTSVTMQRDRLLAERDLLLAERARLTDARERAVADRTVLAQQLDDARRRLDASPSAGDQRQYLAQTDALRAQIVARDQGLAVLRAERDDRTQRLVSAETELASMRQRLAAAYAERDAALAARDMALRERDTALRTGSTRPDATGTAREAFAARDAAFAQRDALVVERDRLAAERDAAFRERDALLAEREAAFRTGGGWQGAPRAESPRTETRRDVGFDALRAERDAAVASRDGALGALGAFRNEAQALRDERDALALQLEALRVASDRVASDRVARPAAPARPAMPARPAAPQTPPSPAEPARDGAFFFLPGFDFGRLQNPDLIQRRIDATEYPAWAAAGRLEGDVLVLFQTDPTGRVIRTAVPLPLGGGLDAIAEGLVREMRFIPPVVDGQPTGLRSQVTVRFER